MCTTEYTRRYHSHVWLYKHNKHYAGNLFIRANKKQQKQSTHQNTMPRTPIHVYMHIKETNFNSSFEEQ